MLRPSRRAARRAGRASPALAVALLAACAGAPPPAAPVRAPPTGAPAEERGERYGGPETPIALAPVEAAALELARARLARGGRPPEPSPALARAARELAAAAARGGDATSNAALRNALARALASDAAPSIRVQRGPADVVAGLLADAVPAGRATHAGVGAAAAPDGGVVLVLLASERGARLDPFPRELPAGATAQLSGALRPGLARPRVFVTRPDGRSEQVPSRGDPAFSAKVAFPAPGRHAVEVVADGAGGPTVAALFVVSVGGAPLDAPARARAEDPADRAEAEAAVVRALNATRRLHGLAPLASSPAVAAVARRHSEAMLAAGEVAHRLPDSLDLGARLRRAGIPYRLVFENLGRARTALEAHEVVEASPAHRANILNRSVGQVGVGIARGRLRGDPIVYLTEIFVEGPDDGSSTRLTPAERVRQALWAERTRLGAPPLTADAVLDALAEEAARAMRAADRPAEGDLASRALASGRGLAAVDVYVASSPAEAARSRNVGDARFRRVGVGISTGDSPRYGAGRAWIAVVYTD
jgi:uncharacterized protein YkwD